jgi:hypothetical protein
MPMPTDQLETFTDRREELTLFDLLRGRDPTKPWPSVLLRIYRRRWNNLRPSRRM